MNDRAAGEGEAAIGRLARGPHPVLFEILYEPHFLSDRAEILPWLLRIDAVHVIMLAQTGVLARAHAAALLAVNRDLTGRLAAGEEILPPPSHRGLYFVYERHFIDRLGSEVGGAAHVARSRNDINATVTRLRLRAGLLGLLDVLLATVAAATGLAEAHVDTLMSGFTHLQPAQPTTLGHYLAAVSAELLRGAARLAAAYDETNRSPLGAGAGLGTSFPIDRELSASLLGFGEMIENSLDAVASRDYAVSALSAIAAVGITLTRLAFDFQLWGSEAYRFLDWPDDFVSTSSMMPQKRNAFVLENVRGQAVRPSGALMTVLLGLKNTPFSNSVEISSEVAAHLWPAVAALEAALRLGTLMLDGVQVRRAGMREFVERSETTMTALADHLVRHHGLSFRLAHEVVGTLLGHARQSGRLTVAEVRAGLLETSRRVLGYALDLSEEHLATVLDPVACVQAASHGGGPAPETVRSQLRQLEARRQGLVESVALYRRQLAAADRSLEKAAAEVLAT